jgi:hypothetical protein
VAKWLTSFNALGSSEIVSEEVVACRVCRDGVFFERSWAQSVTPGQRHHRGQAHASGNGRCYPPRKTNRCAGAPAKSQAQKNVRGAMGAGVREIGAPKSFLKRSFPKKRFLKRSWLKNQPLLRDRVSHASHSGKDDDARVCGVWCVVSVAGVSCGQASAGNQVW